MGRADLNYEPAGMGCTEFVVVSVGCVCVGGCTAVVVFKLEYLAPSSHSGMTDTSSDEPIVPQ